MEVNSEITFHSQFIYCMNVYPKMINCLMKKQTLLIKKNNQYIVIYFEFFLKAKKIVIEGKLQIAPSNEYMFFTYFFLCEKKSEILTRQASANCISLCLVDFSYFSFQCTRIYEIVIRSILIFTLSYPCIVEKAVFWD